jgi:putative membrane protein
MLLDALLSVFHFVAVLVLASALGAEAFVLRLPMTGPVMRLLARIDIFVGASAGALIVAGLLRVFFGLKDESYYWAQPFFWAKMAAFALVGLASIPPTRRFLRWIKALKGNETYSPPAVDVREARRMVMIELHLLAFIVLFAALMARNIGAV